jgi:Zn-dependent peptidase ImmA (M78 family)
MFEVNRMSYIYKPFPLDQWVSKFYRRIGINTPEDISEKAIARALRIHLTYSDKRSYSTEIGNFQLINIYKDLDKNKQREVFFHELCHILRHSGFQYRIMPSAFRELQEWDAAHFTRYAAIPFHMLDYVNWTSPTLIEEMANTFKISEEICQYRVNHINRNKQPKKII